MVDARRDGTTRRGSLKRALAPLDAADARHCCLSSVLDDVAPWRGASAEDHAAGLEAVLRLADLTCEGSGREADFRAWQDERSANDDALWLRLVAEHASR